MKQTMTLKVNLTALLMGPFEEKLAGLRVKAWGAFAASLLIGLLSAGLLDDAGYFGRSGSLGIVIGVIYARRRYLLTSRTERRLEGVLRNPLAWLNAAAKKITPGFPALKAAPYQLFSENEVRDEVTRLITDLDTRMFRDEAAIVIASTLIWGYGDVLLSLLGHAIAC
eukprot:TRINITY_DN4364_c0_g1_i2.p1 TRINITY_DN4364_c0_g1~~TRINITY_DN4364_c0_g1_i2.p1  ORF type:complete len:168 (-),score=20.84 TRINITY_DN4364_c0_g1_i2:163-666(-)